MRRKRINRIKFAIALLIILISVGSQAFSVSSSSRQDSKKFSLYEPGEVLVKFKAGTDKAKSDKIKALASATSTLKEVGPKGRKDIHLLKLKPGVSVEEAVRKLKAQKEVAYAEPNYLRKAAYVPNDPYFITKQWGLNNIHAPEAWDIEKGLTNPVIVAVIDTGIDFAHPDLSSKIVGGYNFINPGTEPWDDNGHGTHVSGIIGAATDNGLGIAGVSFGAKIMPLKFADSNGAGYLSDEINAIYYAADNGAKVINISFGSSVYSAAEQGAINYAYGKGVVLVAAAGNDGNGTINYPAGDDHVIGVGATTNQDQKASFSNFNSTVDVVAPGRDIYSTMPTYLVYLNSQGYAQNYDYASGTSMATPFVAGLATLVLSKNPTYTPLQVEQAIEINADDLGIPGRDDYYGYGRINAYRTLALGATSYWFPWYDQVSPGMLDWVLIANPGTSEINADVYLGTTLLGNYLIQAGSRVTPRYPGMMGGPLMVVTNGPALTSQRATYNGSFNEVMGIPDSKLSTQYYFTWYDSQSMSDWILVGNPTTNTSTAQVEIWVGGTLKWSGGIEPGKNITPVFADLMDGPVIVRSTNGVKIFSSQRTVNKGSFSEVMGIPQEDLSTDFYFTWYDNLSMISWVLVGNPNPNPADVTIYVAGVPKWAGTIPPGGRITPQFPNLMDGPVEVASTNGVPIFASERSLYGNSFEELPGLASSSFSTNFCFTWYDNLSMTSWILVGNPNSTAANITIKIGGSIVYQGQVPAKGRIFPQFSMMNGPVVVSSDKNIFCSQRAIFNSSFNEIFGSSF